MKQIVKIIAALSILLSAGLIEAQYSARDQEWLNISKMSQASGGPKATRIKAERAWAKQYGYATFNDYRPVTQPVPVGPIPVKPPVGHKAAIESVPGYDYLESFKGYDLAAHADQWDDIINTYENHLLPAEQSGQYTAIPNEITAIYNDAKGLKQGKGNVPPPPPARGKIEDTQMYKGLTKLAQMAINTTTPMNTINDIISKYEQLEDLLDKGYKGNIHQFDGLYATAKALAKGPAPKPPVVKPDINNIKQLNNAAAKQFSEVAKSIEGSMISAAEANELAATWGFTNFSQWKSLGEHIAVNVK